MNFRLTVRGLTVAAIVLTVVVVLVGAAFAATSAPSFCARCKSHAPYVAQLAESAHAGISCEQCHSKPGPLFFATAELETLEQPVQQLTGHGQKPVPGGVSNQSCRQCHTDAQLYKTITVNGIRVQHKHFIDAGFLCITLPLHGGPRRRHTRGRAHHAHHGRVPAVPQQPLHRRPGAGGHGAMRRCVTPPRCRPALCLLRTRMPSGPRTTALWASSPPAAPATTRRRTVCPVTTAWPCRMPPTGSRGTAPR